MNTGRKRYVDVTPPCAESPYSTYHTWQTTGGIAFCYWCGVRRRWELRG